MGATIMFNDSIIGDILRQAQMPQIEENTQTAYSIVDRSVSGNLVLETVKSVGEYAFYYCTGLTSVKLPVATTICEQAFLYCINLVSLDLPAVTKIGHRINLDCLHLSTVILRGKTMVEALTDCPFYGNSMMSDGVSLSCPFRKGTARIYVPRSLVDAYKTAERWSTYANLFRALEDYTIDGTTTGELDPSKI